MPTINLYFYPHICYKIISVDLNGHSLLNILSFFEALNYIFEFSSNSAGRYGQTKMSTMKLYMPIYVIINHFCSTEGKNIAGREMQNIMLNLLIKLSFLLK